MRRALIAFLIASSLVCVRLATAQSSTGIIKGTVVAKGKVPGNSIIRMGVDPKCAQLNEGARVIQQVFAATIDNHLGNVFVRVIGSFPATPVPKDPVVIDQRKCVYAPRVVGMRLGQTLQFRNVDQVLHNVHSSSAHENSFNVAQPIAGMVYSFTPKNEEVMVKIGCDVHRWMPAYVGVVTNPYFAVSGADGSFEIRNVPAGKYTLEAWHEQLRTVTSAVIVKNGATATAGLTYEIKN